MTETTPAISPSMKMGLTFATTVVPFFLWLMTPMRATPERSTPTRLPCGACVKTFCPSTISIVLWTMRRYDGFT